MDRSSHDPVLSQDCGTSSQGKHQALLLPGGCGTTFLAFSSITVEGVRWANLSTTLPTSLWIFEVPNYYQVLLTPVSLARTLSPSSRSPRPTQPSFLHPSTTIRRAQYAPPSTTSAPFSLLFSQQCPSSPSTSSAHPSRALAASSHSLYSFPPYWP